jgi:ABC-type polysaccharide transport system permease subunit
MELVVSGKSHLLGVDVVLFYNTAQYWPPILTFTQVYAKMCQVGSGVYTSALRMLLTTRLGGHSQFCFERQHIFAI